MEKVGAKSYALSSIQKELNRRQQVVFQVNPKNYPLLLPSAASVAITRRYGVGSQVTDRGSKRRFQFTSPIEAYSPRFKGKSGQGDPFEADIVRTITDALTKASVNYAKLLDPPYQKGAVKESSIKSRLNVGAIRGAAGTAFEAAVAEITGLSKDTEGARFDVAVFNDELKQLFGIKGTPKLGEFKISALPDRIGSFAAKLLSVQGGGRAVTGKKNQKTQCRWIYTQFCYFKCRGSRF